jgi:peroxiredoxin Q/BCP
MLEVGKPAPAFVLPDHNGVPVSLESLRGRRVVLYFYPKDDTPGCTVEACEFTQGLAHFANLNAVVYGCSADDAESHRRFIAKHSLGVGLLSDADNSTMTAYGAWGEKVLYGKTVQGVIRSTVLIDENGLVAAHWPKVKAEGHAAEVAAAIAALAGAAASSSSASPAAAPTAVPKAAKKAARKAAKPASKVASKPAAKKASVASKKAPASKAAAKPEAPKAKAASKGKARGTKAAAKGKAAAKAKPSAGLRAKSAKVKSAGKARSAGKPKSAKAKPAAVKAKRPAARKGAARSRR